eukprot:2712803-Amphidinium_carterae.1
MGGAIITPAAATASAANTCSGTSRAEGSTDRQADAATSDLCASKVKKPDLHPEEEVPDDIPEEGAQDIEGAEPRPEKRA